MRVSCYISCGLLLLLTFAVDGSSSGDSSKHKGGSKPAHPPKTFAVIGGGSAGAIQTLELMRREEVSKVTIFEQADQLGHIKSASGIIAALLITDPGTEYWNVLDDVNDVLEKAEWLHVDRHADKSRLLKFAQRAAMGKLKKDKRAQKPYQNAFFRAGGKIVEELINWKPQLCEAIIGPFCCRPGTRALKWMEDEGKKKGLSCDYLRGVAHIFYTKDDWGIASNRAKAKKGKWELWPAKSKEERLLEDYIQMNLTGAVWQDHHEGFVRVELLFPILTKIFRDSGKVDFALNCNVESFQPTQDGMTVITDKKLSPHCKFTSKEFDKVIVAAGAASVPLLSKVDKNLPWEMIPVKGFAIASSHDFTPPSERMIGIEFEEPGQYIRAQANGGIRYGFGRMIGTFEDELLDPKFEGWDTKFGPKFTGLGRKMLDMSSTKRLAGMRPVSGLGNFPIVKAYTGVWSGILLNSGFGFYGYGLTWKSAQIVADTALHGRPLEDEWQDAVEFTTGVCPVWMPTCWPKWQYYSAAALAFVGLVAGTFFCCRKCCSPTDTKALE